MYLVVLTELDTGHTELALDEHVVHTEFPLSELGTGRTKFALGEPCLVEDIMFSSLVHRVELR